MNVGELIEELKKHNSFSKVMLSTSTGEWYELKEKSIGKGIHGLKKPEKIVLIN